jgi:hypothetical protein
MRTVEGKNKLIQQWINERSAEYLLEEEIANQKLGDPLDLLAILSGGALLSKLAAKALIAEELSKKSIEEKKSLNEITLQWLKDSKTSLLFDRPTKNATDLFSFGLLVVAAEVVSEIFADLTDIVEFNY